MPDEPTLREIIRDAAARPKSVTDANGRNVTERDLSELSELQSTEAPAKPHFGIRFTKLIPPGAG